MMRTKFLLFVLLITSVIVMAAPAAAQSSWDDVICEGNEAYVWRVVNGTTSDIEASEGCDDDDEMGWLVVEPWGPNGLNPDRACFASDWTTLYSIVQDMDWVNGSTWRVVNEVEENPLVVNCSEVDIDADLGLNPGEGQVELRSIRALIARANELLEAHDFTRSRYIAEYEDTPISELFTLIDLLSMGNSD